MDSIKYINAAFKDSIETKQKALNTLTKPLVKATEILLECLTAGGKVMVCGNGGSAADAQHFAAELVGRFESDRQGLAAIALTTDSSALTAIANDFGHQQIFSRQLTALANPGDALLAISTSGNSANVNQAIREAQTLGLRIIALTGRNGGEVSALMMDKDVELRVPASNTARIQEVHILLLHCLCGLIEKQMLNPDIP